MYVHVQPQYQTLWLPNNTMVNITGECGDNYRDLRLSWDNNSIEMAFGIVSIYMESHSYINKNLLIGRANFHTHTHTNFTT